MFIDTESWVADNFVFQVPASRPHNREGGGVCKSKFSSRAGGGTELLFEGGRCPPRGGKSPPWPHGSAAIVSIGNVIALIKLLKVLLG